MAVDDGSRLGVSAVREFLTGLTRRKQLNTMLRGAYGIKRTVVYALVFFQHIDDVTAKILVRDGRLVYRFSAILLGVMV